MVAKNQNAEMVSGDSVVLIIAVKDEGGNPIPVTSIPSIDYQLAQTVLGPALFGKTLGTGILMYPAVVATATANVALATHEIAVLLDPADTAALAGKYYHELQVVDEAGGVATLLTGKLKIIQDLIP